MLKELLVNQEADANIGNKNNKNKLYLGMKWNIPSPFTIQKFYNDDKTNFDTTGVYIEEVSEESPFYNTLNKDGSHSLLLGFKQIVTSYDNDQEVEHPKINFGYTEDQKTPGVLFYYEKNTEIQIYFINDVNDKSIQIKRIILDKTYENIDIDITKDYMNIGAL